MRVRGVDAFEHLQHSLSNDLTRIHPGRAQYTHLLDEDGFVVDDIIVWWVDEERFDVMPNASNTTDVVKAIGGTDVTDERAVIAIQGPEARSRLAQMSPEAATVHRFAVKRFEWAGVPCLVAGTGYTGEEGVECAVPAEVALDFWKAVLGQGVAPAGLGLVTPSASRRAFRSTAMSWARASRRCRPGLGWVIGWDKGDFTGRAALEEEKANGPARRLRGFVADGRQPLRDGSLLCEGEEQVGILTSGNFSPMRERGIGLGFVDADARLLDGDAITIVQRGREIPARLVRPPLWPIRGGDASSGAAQPSGGGGSGSSASDN